MDLSIDQMYLEVPDTHIYLNPGMKVKLGRFSQERWIVEYGWYSFGGNRPVCGWYLTDIQDSSIVKPIQLQDLSDIFIVEQ